MLLLALLGAACSSTARDGAAGAPTAADAAAAAGAESPSPDAGGVDASTAGATPSAGAAPDGGAATPAAGGGGIGAAAGGAESDPETRSAVRWGEGPGVTRDEIAIGVAVDMTWRKQLEGVGYGLDAGDPPRAAQVAAEILNGQGGIAGRRIRIVPWQHSDSNVAYDTAACAHFTEDIDVFTVVQFGPSSAVTRKCFGDRGMPVIDSFGSEVSEREDLSHHYGTASLTLERLAATVADRLSAAAFFSSGKRLGIVTYDAPKHRRVTAEVLVPRLRAHGQVVTSIAYLAQGLDAATRDSANAVTEFRRQGIELVIIFEGHAGASGPFTHVAASQQASFRYGLASVSHPSMQARNRKYLVHESALRSATVVGWHPTADLLYDRGGVRELPPAAHHWRRLLAQRGLTFPQQCCALGAALTMVERLTFLKAGLEAAPGDGVSRERLRAGVASLGDRFDSVLTARTWFSAGRHDGVGAVRLARWSDACECLRYTSSPMLLPRRAAPPA